MCLGELAEVIAVTERVSAVVRCGGSTRTVSLLTLDTPLAPGDWVVSHSGFALSRLTPQEAQDAARIRATADVLPKGATTRPAR